MDYQDGCIYPLSQGCFLCFLLQPLGRTTTPTRFVIFSANEEVQMVGSALVYLGNLPP
ncbi:MAG: hypothetical protein ACK5YY_04430 [Alphaproteobacteria bacterium]|nr:hypothetical protein [Alphaproteobacteria bacterium]